VVTDRCAAARRGEPLVTERRANRARWPLRSSARSAR